jgi:hypothetical protein
MKKKIWSSFVVGAMLASSCNKEFKELLSENSVTANNEVIHESYSLDVEDISSAAIASDLNAGGRELGIDLDDRFKCSTVTRTSLGTYSGTILIDFGADGCKDSKGNVRKGKISIEYKGKRYQPGSTFETKLEDYSINDLKVEGTRKISYESSSKDDNQVSKVTLNGGKLTWPDGSFSEHNFARIRTSTKSTASGKDTWEWTLTGSGSGTSRKGVKYTMEISKPLKYKKECESVGVFIAVSGIKLVKKDAKDITIDYGNDLCNNLVTVSYNGTSKVIEINKKGG